MRQYSLQLRRNSSREDSSIFLKLVIMFVFILIVALSTDAVSYFVPKLIEDCMTGTKFVHYADLNRTIGDELDGEFSLESRLHKDFVFMRKTFEDCGASFVFDDGFNQYTVCGDGTVYRNFDLCSDEGLIGQLSRIAPF